jgi:dihydrofolate synthase/folylpolyglutamate synthase
LVQCYLKTMTELKTFAEANKILASFIPTQDTGSYSTDRIRKFMEYLGNPQDKSRVIHVAGTSGKTSTCYYVASLLVATGKRVGLTVSPHVDQVSDRLQIDLVPLAEAEFCQTLSEFLVIVDKSGFKLSYFELLVALAYWEFERQKVDYAVIEVGLGGLLDGTNVVSRADKICVITDIGLDHITTLGDTLEKIAVQKAGIIQNSNVGFAYSQSPEVNKVFMDIAKAKHAKLNILDQHPLPDNFLFLPLFQQRNFGLALQAANYALSRDYDSIISPEEQLRAARVLIPARMEIFTSDDKTIILDGAHNAQKLHALIGSIKAKYPDQAVTALVSFVGGRSYRLESSLDEIATLCNNLILTAFSDHQDLPHNAVKPQVLAEMASPKGFASLYVEADPVLAFKKLLDRPEKILVVTGSFFIMNEVRPLAKAL